MTPRELVATRAGRNSLVAGAVLAVGIAVASRGARPAAPRRIAIEAHCADAVACALVERLAVDVWSEQHGPGLPIDVVVLDRDLAQLAAAGVTWEVLVDDIDAVARDEAQRLRAAPAVQAFAQPADWYAEYRDYRAITTRMNELAELAPELVSVHGIGNTIENRPLWAVRIGGRTADARPMLINGTQHAREWISAMVTTCVAERLVRGYAQDPAIRAFVDRTELWVIPVVNPDGYQYSWAGSRYWRKNRRGSHGVDLNRNWDLAWGGLGSSNRRSAEDYHGESPFSEPETAAIRDLVKREGIALHVDFHAFGQLLLYPWGYTATPAPDKALLAAIGDRMASAMFAAHQAQYKLISSVELYPAAGTMTDWLYGGAKALSYTVELRPGRGGRSGFVLPPAQIAPTCDEGLAAVLALRAAH